MGPSLLDLALLCGDPRMKEQITKEGLGIQKWKKQTLLKCLHQLCLLGPGL